jgi:hypothetical protein
MPTVDIPDKICPKCDGTKYYHRIYKKVSVITGKNYEHYECRNCNMEMSKNYAFHNVIKIREIKKTCYLKYKHDPVRKKIRNENAKKSRELRKDDEEYKERIKNYAIKSFQILKNSLSDRYIKDRLIYESNIKILDRNEIPQDLIELKRKQLLLTRKIKNNG